MKSYTQSVVIVADKYVQNMNKCNFFYVCIKFVHFTLYYQIFLYKKDSVFEEEICKNAPLTERIFVYLLRLLEVYESFIPDCGCFIAKKIYGSSRNGGKSEVNSICLNRVLISCEVIVNDTRNGVESVAGLSLK